MKCQVTRRDFLKVSAAVGEIAIGGNNTGLGAESDYPDVTVAKRESPSVAVRAAIASIGGMQRFVSRGDRVVLLPNPQGRQPGTSTNAEVVEETVKMCFVAGASEVAVCSIHGLGRWRPTGILEAVERAGGKMQYPKASGDWINVDIPRGEILRKTSIIRRSQDCDVLINMPIAKQHDSTRFTCSLKNLMGFNTDNSSFHQGETHLQQCIVDLASIFRPTLCIVDANTVLTENGPFGPGRTLAPQKVFAATNMVSIDALCCGLLDLSPSDVGHIRGAHELGLGEMDLSKLKVKRDEA
jgi:uncharacterized protein (DUF362 family)